MSQDCIFCRIASGDIPANKVYEDDAIVAFHDLEPQAPVHVLLIPRRHISTLLDTSPDESELLGSLQSRAVEIARELGLDAKGFRLVTNCLAEAGQSVFHIHLHLLGGRKFTWPPG
ncbi:MAG: histidine triad nucleotide-binding protein [bacterium]|nr:histidine triad nucleotide-binding protein [bacterium]